MDSLVPLLGILVALILGIVGIFQDWIRSLFKKPELKTSIKLEPPDCHKIAIRNSQTGQFVCDSYYFRFWVKNIGNYQMEEAEAMATELYKKVNIKYEKVKIQPKLFKHLDLGHIVKNEFANLNLFGLNSTSNIVLILDVEVPPNTGSHIIFPGDYKIKIVLAANNLKPVEKIYNIVIKDNWTDDEDDMLAKNVSIKEKNGV